LPKPSPVSDYDEAVRPANEKLINLRATSAIKLSRHVDRLEEKPHKNENFAAEKTETFGIVDFANSY
jgi:hypothetical protein